MGELTLKQKAFVNEYLQDHNATKAAIRAGYSNRSAEVTGHRLLRNAKISAEIDRKKEELAAEFRQQFLGDAIKAREVMLEVLNDPNSSNRDKIAVSKDLLDRAGFGPIDKKELSGSCNEPIEILFREPNK